MLSRQQLKGLTTVAVGDLVYISPTSGSLAVLADVAAGQVLVSGGIGAAPAYSPSPTLTSPIINSSGGGTIQIPEGTPVNAVAARGTITMSGIATAEQTFIVGTQTFTWKAAREAAGQVTVGVSASEAVTNIVTAITADLATVAAVDGDGDTVVITAATKGVSGNAIDFTEDSTNMAVDGTGHLGGTIAGVDGTIGAVNELRADATYLYHAISANTIADANWRRIALGAVY